MNFRIAFFALLALVAAFATSSSFAADSVKTARMTYVGTIKSTSPTEIEFERTGSTANIPVNEVLNIVRLDGEPREVSAARAHAAAGRFNDAAEALAKVKPADLKRDVTKAEFDFLKAYVAARTALAGTGDVAKAGSAMVGFVKNHPNSFHVLQANELIGDLLVAGGNYAAAAGYYEKLAAAPWPAYQMRAKVLLGKAKLAEGKTEEAKALFQSVVDADAKGADATTVAADLGIARCLAAEKKYEEAIAAARKVIAAVDPENTPVSAQAYNTLGTALAAAGKKRDAVMAFLHVDVLYFNSPDDHAEALENLAELWTELNRPERATKVKQVLKQRYNK